MELFPFFHQIFKILILFVLYFKNYKRQMVSWNCKHAQHVKIYLPCNFEVNLITHLVVIALFSSIFFFILILFVLYFKNYLEIDGKFKLQTCAACQDLPTLQFWSKSHYSFWPIMQIRKKGGWNKKNILLWNYRANLNQTLLKWSMGGPLSKLCPSAPSCIQDGHHY